MRAPSSHPQRAAVSAADHDEIEAFLYREARLLDSESYDDWLALLAPDIKYVISTSPSLYRREDRSAHLKDIAHIEDGLIDLQRRVQRYQSSTAWAEDPPTRHCHAITNIEVEPAGTPNEFRVYSVFVNCRGRFETEDVIMMGRREDIIRRHLGGLRLAFRRVQLTQNVLLSRNINTFL